MTTIAGGIFIVDSSKHNDGRVVSDFAGLLLVDWRSIRCHITGKQSLVRVLVEQRNEVLGRESQWSDRGWHVEKKTMLVSSLTDVSAIMAGGFHTCALTNKRTACWGHKTYGQLGIGSAVAKTTPVVISSLYNGTMLAAGQYFTCELSVFGTASAGVATTPISLVMERSWRKALHRRHRYRRFLRRPRSSQEQIMLVYCCQVPW